MTSRVLQFLPARKSAFFTLDKKLSGSVDRLGVAGRYVVVALDKKTMFPLGKTVSDADGNYALRYLPNTAIFVIAVDHSAEPVNAAISDQLTLEPMP